MVGWAQETTLDVEYAHAMAPGAKIVLVETPVAETEGVTGLPEMMNAEKSLIDHGVGDVITQSFGATENTFPGFDQGNFSSLMNLRYAFKDARRTASPCSPPPVTTARPTPSPTAAPVPVPGQLLAVVGPAGHLDRRHPAQPGRQRATSCRPTSCGTTASAPAAAASRSVFSAPGRTRSACKDVVGNHRGTPDISMSAAVDGGAWVYYSFVTRRSPLAHLRRHQRGHARSSPASSRWPTRWPATGSGNINPALYAARRASQHAQSTGLVDVTSGNNSFDGVTGFDAGTGYDLATGLGTIDALRFVPALARASHHG